MMITISPLHLGIFPTLNLCIVELHITLIRISIHLPDSSLLRPLHRRTFYMYITEYQFTPVSHLFSATCLR
jgi:hypothetical protein